MASERKPPLRLFRAEKKNARVRSQYHRRPSELKNSWVLTKGETTNAWSAVLKPEEIEFLYNMQVKLSTFDHSIDNTQIPAAEIARSLLAW
jgi:hypothetical protein